MNSLTFHVLWMLLVASLSPAQSNVTANDFVPAYDAPFRFGANMGAYQLWKDEQLADIAAGNPALGIEGVGVDALRPLLSEWFLEFWGYDIRIDAFRHYQSLGIEDNVVFIGYPSPEHRDSTYYCPNAPSELFANLYTPIWDNRENGTPVNDSNYYALYLWKMVSLYHPYVRFWEIWNEPDFDFEGKSSIPPGQPGNWWEYDPEPCDYALRAPISHYIRMLRISYEVIKSIAPEDYVAIGGIGYPSFLDAVLRHSDNPADGSVDSLYPLKGGAYFDVLSFHSYPHIDNSLRVWDNSIADFRYFRHSDRALDGLLDRQTRLRRVLEKHGYDGSVYPKKLWIVTESNLPRVAFDEYIGSQEAQINYVLKAIVACQQHNIRQFHLYQMGDTKTREEASNEFQLMGLYQALDNVPPYTQRPNALGVAYRTASQLLKGKQYDPIQTKKLELPSNVRGGAFRDEKGFFTYVLWAATSTDRSEWAEAVYSFPPSLNVGMLNKRTWDFTARSITTVADGGYVALTGAPVFLTDSQAEILGNDIKQVEMKCSPNPFRQEMEVRLELPEAVYGSLAMVDQQGRLVADFFANLRLASGKHSLKISIEDVSPGIYWLFFKDAGKNRTGCKVYKR